jgi:hypothetical protein
MKLNMNRPKILLLCAFSVIAITSSIPAQADGAGAFLGGIAVARIGSNVRDRRDYEEDQAYYSQQQAQATQSQAYSQKSPQQRIAELDKLAAGGYITPEEYKAKKQSILDGM